MSPRELRPRTARPSYTAVYQDEGDNQEAGPSRPRPALDDEGSNGSDFAPAQAEAEPSEDEEILDANTEPEEDVDPRRSRSVRDEDASNSLATPPTVSRRPSKAKVKSTPGISRPLNRQMYTRPIPSVNHRHKAIPIFRRDAPVERLVRPPVLFGANDIASTNSYTSDAVVTDRLNKAWGYNVGPGPLWEVLEDRGWFKESEDVDGQAEREEWRRPRVHRGVAMSEGWSVLSPESASSYLPTDTTTTDDGTLKPPPPVSCAFGPFNKQTSRDVHIFDTFAMSEYLPENTSHVFNAGAPVWGMDWCPIHPADRPALAFKQFLAVAPLPTRAHSPEIGVKAPRPSHACIQIWSLGPPPAASNHSKDNGMMRCEMVLCIESGAAHDLKWCPLPSHDELAGPPTPGHIRKLGLLAGTFEDGSLSIYVVPYPPDVRHLQPSSNHDSLFLKLSDPIIRLELEEAACWSLDWGNSELLAVGCTNGAIAVYDIAPVLRSPAQHGAQNLLPTHYIHVHQSAVRAISWIRTPTLSGTGERRADDDPTVLASGGYDGLECLTDIRDPMGNIMNRTRDVITAFPYSPYAGGPVTIDHENIVKAFSVSPSMLGRGHTLMEPAGPVWSLGTSDYHPQLAVGAADGTCSTTNMLRSTRRGGTVPFLVHKIYQLDYSRSTQTYRMLDRFLPYETPDRTSAIARSKAKSKRLSADGEGDEPATGTGAWPTEVGVLRVAWNSGNGLAAAGLLASATASGLCRVDHLQGRWMRGKVPYESVELMRKEGDGEFMDVDEEDEEDD
ncbi:hypothetical protein FA95DRAFT_1587504 [Auriscalpium vulgare]|uniref:Uncharacterized protein n=1 Tax=Auriscalpium vulgare TaxID=40419 RepID=A0ACB8S2W2_9AGAM|nr:hypothetical protein FA95DRAFT_1587504 [Auriscalpium vulgare]